MENELRRWMRLQRWFQTEHDTDPFEIKGLWQIANIPVVSIVLVNCGSATYVVPLVETSTPLADGDLIAKDRTYLYDATSCKVGQAALYQAMSRSFDGSGICLSLDGHRGADKDIVDSSRLSGEQSNTSIRYQCADGTSTILKVFRVLGAGQNPDVTINEALTDAECPYVAPNHGYIAGTWKANGTVVSGHVVAAQEFLTGAVDAWQVMTDLARQPMDDDTYSRIVDLGAATRTLHETLAECMETVQVGTNDKDRVTNQFRQRALKALGDAPSLDKYSDAIDQVYTQARQADTWPTLQRVHGDLHLGQVVDVPNKGWVFLDFEGEPLRPLAQRVKPDIAVRDVAGMLRSFDYVAGYLIHAGSDEKEAQQWAAAARNAYLEGYGDIDSPELLTAFELDKALYEVSYETNQRPDWVNVPLTGVKNLLKDSSALHEEEEAMNNPLPIATDVLAAVAEGRYHAPHDILGPHPSGDNVVIRVVRHLAKTVTIVTEDKEYQATHEYGGVWIAIIEGSQVPDYRVKATYSENIESLTDDPYRFLPSIGEIDLYLFGEGRHEALWKVLGAHTKTYESTLGDVHGTAFTVWAPSARAIRVVGDFNYWNGVSTAMRSLGSSGVWELFVPGAEAGQRYKYEIQYQDGSWHQKADPMARRTEIPPSTASIIAETHFDWEDQEWLDARASTNPIDGPVSVYEVHLGSWRPGLNFHELAEHLIGHVKYLGFTHVEFMPVAEHPFGGSWGYQVSSYYAPTARFGSPDEFRYLINELHKAGIGIIMDWVPAHFPKDDWALARFDGTPLYEDPDPLRGEHPDWGTLIFNYGRREVRNFLVANALYWLEEFHIDGIRVDAVASMLYLDYSREADQWRPNIHGGRENLEAISFLQEANATAYRLNPGIMMIAEESTSWPGVTSMTDGGGLGFGLKWNMGWMNDTLHYMAEEPINRRYHHGEITFSLVYAFSEQFMLPISHDEVVHGKGSLYTRMPGDKWQKLAGVRLLYAYQWAHPGKQLIFMGQEFAQVQEWSETRGVDWYLTEDPDHDRVMALVSRLNEVYTSYPALHTDDFSNHGFEWIEVSDGDHNVLSFLRKSADGQDEVVAVINFAGTPHEDYRVGVPHGGFLEEIVNTDATEYGGSGVGNMGGVEAEEIPWNGRPYSVKLRVPPLGALYLAPRK